MFCISCGDKQPNEAKFCSNCGKSLAPISSLDSNENASSTERSKNADSSTAVESDSTTQAKQDEDGTSEWYFIAIGIFVGLIFFGSKFTDIFSRTRHSPLLENATVIGKSTRADFQRFVDEGGLQNHPAWHGLYVSNVQVFYYPNNVVRSMSMEFAGKADGTMYPIGTVSPKEIRQQLTTLCGLSDSVWVVESYGGYGSRKESGGQLTCGYQVSKTGGISATISAE